MNKYDSEKLRGMLAKQGMERASTVAEADLILLNTCSIRAKAEQKVFSRLGRLAVYKQKNRNLLIAVGGCMATLRKEEIFRRAPSVDIVFGPDSLSRLPELIDDCRTTGKKSIDVEFGRDDVWDTPEEGVRDQGVSAWVGIMKGCDNHCTYCVVPSTRGPEVSRTPESVVAEVERLVADGFKEINLLGQNVNSYGKSLSRQADKSRRSGLAAQADFPALLRLVDSVDGVKRIRFMTSHPKDLNDGLIDAMASARRVCPSIHLPVQAGSDRILGAMGRGYTAAEYIKKIDFLREAIPGIAISTDIMVGFPSESEEEFQETLKLMERVRFDSLYLFIYSPRPGTVTEKLSEAVSRQAASERFNRAKALNYSIITEKNRLLVGQTVEVLCEGFYNESNRNGNDRSNGWFGRTPENSQVIFYSDHDWRGKVVSVTITDLKGYNLKGTVCRQEAD